MRRFSAYLAAILLVLLANGVSARGQCNSMGFGPQGCWGGPPVSAALYVKQWRGPAGYSVRLYIPGRRTGDVLVSVQNDSLFIRSGSVERTESARATGSSLIRFGSFQQWLTLPADADTSQMKLTSRGPVIGIFIPRRR